MGQPEPPFPQGPLGGQTFASTLLLSFSCAPLLKQHLLRTLSMTNEELASLEPIIAQAWEQWDHQRRMHYAQQAQVANAVQKPPDGHALAEASSAPYGDVGMADHAPQYTVDPSHPQANEFRARFHRSLVAPSPFRTFGAPQPNSTSSSSASVPGSESLDPHMGVAVVDHGQKAVIDPELGQARGEAEGVVGRLERG
ncbi:hypothetical protein BV25DRAFT_1822878 [Artomyces pyxidatus]|uniref:Uncharacterized protein n=1 Tax=Artomyces pyxidatus TaxID=48021 RepID=A0ACB8T8M5_9AGAM|nr:hypothetical protein BV25DRAFT_1822878 [Artomyces pyxidatus]